MSTNLHKIFATDTQAEQEGREVEVTDGVHFRVRSQNSDRVRKWSSRRSKKNRKYLVGNGEIPIKVQDEDEISMVCEVLVVGWRGVKDAEGKDIAYSTEACRKLMTELPPLRRQIILLSALEETFRKEETEAIVGNSPTPSGQPTG